MEETRFRYRFGTAEFDEARLQLRVDGNPVALQRRPLEVLRLLLARPGELVSKAVIFDTVWAGMVVEDGALPNAVSKLRASLGVANSAAIVTVSRSGYRFDGDVERISSEASDREKEWLTPGATVRGRPRYLLRRKLGGNGGCETWLAEQPKTGDRRVFKFAHSGEGLPSLQREWTLTRLLRKELGARQDFVRLFDSSLEEPPYWIESEFAGDNLDEWARAPCADGSTRLAGTPLPERIALVLQVADALAAAHRVGVLHKDLKPSNILVERGLGGWQIRLTDFGSSGLLDPAAIERLRLTRLGFDGNGDPTSGTPYYLAPELLVGGESTEASDLFALGVILYQMTVGDLRRPLAPGWERSIPDELLREDISAATDIDPAQRPGSVIEFASALRRLAERREVRERERAALAAEQAMREADARALQNHVAVALGRMLREDLIAAANPTLQGRADITVAEALTGAAERIDTKYADLPSIVRGSLHATLQAALGDLSRSIDAVEAGRRAIAALVAGATDSAGALDALQEARLRLVLDLVQLSKLEEARAAMFELEAAALPPKRQPAAFRARLLLVKSWLTGGDFAFHESLAQLEEAYALVESVSIPDDGWRGRIIFALADNYALVGRLAESELLYRRLLGQQVERFGVDHARTHYTRVGLANAVARQGRHAEARELLVLAAAGLERRLGVDHRQTLTALDMLADVHFRENEFVQAEQMWKRVHAGYAALMGARSSFAITVLTNRALCLHRAGDAAAAEPLLRDALVGVRGFAVAEAPQAQQVRYALAECLLDLDHVAEAATLAAGLDAHALNLAQPESDWPLRLQRLAERLSLVSPDVGDGR